MDSNTGHLMCIDQLSHPLITLLMENPLVNIIWSPDSSKGSSIYDHPDQGIILLGM